MTEDQAYAIVNTLDQIAEALWAVNKRLVEIDTAIRSSG